MGYDHQNLQCTPDQLSLPEPQMSMRQTATPAQDARGNSFVSQQIDQKKTRKPAARPKRPTKWTSKSGEALAKDVGDTTSVVSTVSDLVHEGTSGRGGPAGADPMGGAFNAISAASKFAECMAGGDNVAESTGGSALACLAKTGIDQLDLGGGGASTVWGFVNMANDRMDVDNGGKVFSQFGADLNPYSNVKSGLSSMVDTADVVTSGNPLDPSAEQLRKAEALEDRNRAGKNSVVAQGGQAIVDAATGNTDAYVDRKAATGERGLWNAWGNAAGDLNADVFGKGASSRSRRVTRDRPSGYNDGTLSGYLADSFFELFH